jgi:hypothetical protein
MSLYKSNLAIYNKGAAILAKSNTLTLTIMQIQVQCNDFITKEEGL